MQDLALRSMSSFVPAILGVSGGVLVMELGGSPITKPYRDLAKALGVLHGAFEPTCVHVKQSIASLTVDLAGTAICSWWGDCMLLSAS